MGYKYITENNLYEKQTYMYSAYKGIDFIKEYLNSRENCLKEIKKRGGYKDTKPKHSFVYGDLVELCEKLKAGKKNDEIMQLVNAYTKSFEVRKRIYSEYDAEWKPLSGTDFEEYESYIVFAECLLLAYRYTKCLKYFNCLLKLDDTLISIQNKLDQQLRIYLSQVLRQELNIFNELVAAIGVNEGVS